MRALPRRRIPTDPSPGLNCTSEHGTRHGIERPLLIKPNYIHILSAATVATCRRDSPFSLDSQLILSASYRSIASRADLLARLLGLLTTWQGEQDRMGHKPSASRRRMLAKTRDHASRFMLRSFGLDRPRIQGEIRLLTPPMDVSGA